MVIAINTRILSADKAASKILINWFVNNAAGNKAHQFYFISTEALHLPAAVNIKNVVIKQQTSNTLLWKLWYNYKLPAALKKIKADVLISADGTCSLRTKLPQYVMVNELEFFKHPEWYNKKYVAFAKSNMPSCLQKATGIITHSEAVKNEITNRFGMEGSKITIATLVNNTKWKPLSWDEKQAVKDTYTDGNEYFLFCGAIHNSSYLINLLKAFSQFKKRQKSSLQLVILTDEIPLKNPFIESLRLYKYRAEIKLLAGLSEDEIILITAAAYCAVGLSSFYNEIHYLQHAIRCEVPVIAGDIPQSKELLTDAALYANPSSIDAIAGQMMLVYKDEKLQNELVQNGKRLYKQQAANELWEMIVSPAIAR